MKNLINKIEKRRENKLRKAVKKSTKTVYVGEGELRPLEVEYKPTSWDDTDYRWYDKNGVEFDGHHDLFSLEIKEYNYLKESELSGDEWRKGGTYKIIRNGQVVYEDFFREMEYGIKSAWRKFDEIQGFYHWDDVVEGKKLYYKDMPCYIEYVFWDQGTMVLCRDNDELFPLAAYDQEDLKSGDYYEDLDDRTSIKIDIFDDDVWWWRDDEEVDTDEE